MVIQRFLLLSLIALGLTSLTAEIAARGLLPAPDSFRATLEPVPNPPLLWEDGSYVGADTAWIGLAVTRNGGGTWQRVALSRDARKKLGIDESRWKSKDYQDLVYAEILRHTRFVSATHGWLFIVYGESAGHFWETKDGGRTWVRSSGALKASEGSTVARLFFIDDKVGWALLKSDAAGTYSTLHTSDGGQTWRGCGTPVKTLLFQIESPFFISQQQGWAVLFRNDAKETECTLVVTQDAGCSWTPRCNVRALQSSITGCSEIFFLNESQGWMVLGPGGTGAFQTHDGGRSWDVIATPQSSAGFTSVYFKSERDGWLIREDGAVLSTTSGGVDWDIWSGSQIPPVLSDATRDMQWKRGLLYLMYLRGTQLN